MKKPYMKPEITKKIQFVELKDSPSIIEFDYFESETFGELAALIEKHDGIDRNDLIICGDGRLLLHPVLAADFMAIRDQKLRYASARAFTRTAEFKKEVKS